jgi:hypothetical protein
VCSGCSGDYAGDWEDPGELGADSGGSDCPLGTGGKREPQGNWPNSERARHFEDSADSECDSRWASLPGESGQSAGEICEIMVSATRIVEIRVIKCGERKESSDAGAAETSGANQHSKAESAKYYQTRGGDPGRPSDRAQVPRCRWVAASAAGAFKRWGRWARKAFRI